MDQKLQELIQGVCSELPTLDVRISNVFDLRRFARMAYYAWKQDIGFHPEMFKDSLKKTELFQNLPEEVLDAKSIELCHQADFAKDILHATFDLENLKI